MFIIAPLQEVETVLRRHPQAHVCGLLGPDLPHPPLPVPEERRLKLTFNDVAAPAPGFIAPEPDHVRALLDFAERWRAAARGPLLVHCWAGISRSTAAAFVARCHIEPQRDEADIARELRAVAPFATPNPLIVRLADELLGRSGRMTTAARSIGRGREAFSGDVVEWPLPRV